MGKRKNETQDEKRERKKRKKEAKKRNSSDAAPLAAAVPIKSRNDKQQHDNTVFFQKTIQLAISVLPSALANIQMHLEDSLRASLLQYSAGIKGTLLAFDNVKILGKGTIFNELPHIHYQVSADVVVFAPTTGCSLTGIVTEASFHSHLSLIVLHHFNASIAAQEMMKDFTFEDDAWTFHGMPVRKGDVVAFTCQKMYESGGIISIAGCKPKINDDEL